MPCLEQGIYAPVGAIIAVFQATAIELRYHIATLLAVFQATANGCVLHSSSTTYIALLQFLQQAQLTAVAIYLLPAASI